MDLRRRGNRRMLPQGAMGACGVWWPSGALLDDAVDNAAGLTVRRFHGHAQHSVAPGVVLFARQLPDTIRRFFRDPRDVGFARLREVGTIALRAPAVRTTQRLLRAFCSNPAVMVCIRA